MLKPALLVGARCAPDSCIGFCWATGLPSPLAWPIVDMFVDVGCSAEPAEEVDVEVDIDVAPIGPRVTSATTTGDGGGLTSGAVSSDEENKLEAGSFSASFPSV